MHDLIWYLIIALWAALIVSVINNSRMAYKLRRSQPYIKPVIEVVFARIARDKRPRNAAEIEAAWREWERSEDGTFFRTNPDGPWVLYHERGYDRVESRRVEA